MWAGAVVEIGNPRGRIALYLDEAEARNLAAIFPPPNMGGAELLEAIKKAYPAAAERPAE